MGTCRTFSFFRAAFGPHNTLNDVDDADYELRAFTPFFLFVSFSFFGSDFGSDFGSNFGSNFGSDFGSDSLISLKYSMPTFSANSFGLFYE